MRIAPLVFVFYGLLVPALPAFAELPSVGLSADGKRLVFTESGAQFIPWGFNYDHDRDGRLLEDYWDDEWPTVVADFREMKTLGANVVRIHLQYGKFMESPTTPRSAALEQLKRLVELAEQTELYLDITGLGCYHKQDVPDWYAAFDEEDRWQAQAKFWEAVAAACSSSPAVFCYDLMNEPVVPGDVGKRSDWLGPAFGDKHFVQFITLETKGRPRADIARQWIDMLVSAIRHHDERHLVTVGLVPWSLDRPGLTSGFVPEKIAPSLDFVAVHIYPEHDKLPESLDTLKQFAAADKPVLIEEIFPLQCSDKELEQFISDSKQYAAGWIGFYWGKTPDEYRPPSGIGDAITLSWLELFQRMAP